MMSLLTELGLFLNRNLQRCQPYGLEKICVQSVFHLWPEIQTPIAPIVHPKMKTGKECSSAECARLRSRLHCVTTRRVASTRQGVRSAPPFDFRHHIVGWPLAPGRRRRQWPKSSFRAGFSSHFRVVVKKRQAGSRFWLKKAFST